MAGQNQKRVLAQVLAIDAWHKPFRTDERSSAVYVDLSFHEGRIGGDDESIPFTFRIRLKRALLSVQVEQPLRIDRGSVARSVPINEAEHSQVLSLNEKAKRNFDFRGKVSPASIFAAAGGGVSNEQNLKTEDRLRLTQTIPKIIATPKPKSQNEYAWELAPGYDQTLDGPPWNAIDAPRFSVLPLRRLEKISPAIKVTLSCRFEDIEIDDLQHKYRGPLAALKEGIFNQTNMAAAIQQIKHTLIDAELEFGSLDDRFSEIILADILADEQ